MKEGLRSLVLELDEEEEEMASWSITENGSMHDKATGKVIGSVSDPLFLCNTVNFDPKDIMFDVSIVLGKGISGAVLKGVHEPTGTPLAVKVVALDSKTSRDHVRHDLAESIVLGVKCPNLIQFYVAHFDASSTCVYIAMEYMDLGSLHDLQVSLRKSGHAATLPEHLLANVLMQSLIGLNVLHSNDCIHRDIKPHNILINSQGEVKLTDFGISKSLDTMSICNTFVGTQLYMSPERVTCDDYSYSADIWSFGLLVFELSTGALPWANASSPASFYNALLKKNIPKLPQNDDFDFSDELCNLVECCLCRDASERWTAGQLLTHPFFDKYSSSSKDSLVEWLDDKLQLSKPKEVLLPKKPSILRQMSTAGALKAGFIFDDDDFDDDDDDADNDV
eukprot:GHVR01113856.1.p1 GENE.GHVR01113856.1~~GHVR01113856.1.p1  ORF type:complete len:393 (-),score=80.43 GHVR01113856.1:488-1666(-)